MRRYISLACVALIVAMCMVSPVSAAEFDGMGYVDLLSAGYFYVNNTLTYSTTVYVNSDSGSFHFINPFNITSGNFEMLIYTDLPDLTLTNLRGQSATISPSPLGSGYYFVKGTFDGVGEILNYSSSKNGFFIICSVKTCPYNYKVAEITYDFQVFDVTNGYEITSKTGQTRTEFQDEMYYDSIDNPFVRQIRIYPNKDQLTGLDYFDLDLYLQDLEVGSISASFGGNALDIQCTTSFIGDGVYNNGVDFGEIDWDKTYGCYKVDLRVDVSGINLVDGAPTVFITYTSNNYGDRSPYVYVYGINAGVMWSEFDPFLYEFNRLAVNLPAWITQQTNSLISSISTLSSSVNTWLSNQTYSIVSAITNFSQSLDTWLTTHTTTLIDKIHENTVAMQTKWNEYFNALSIYFGRLDTWITNQTATLQAAIRGDTTPGDSFQQEVDQKDQQLNDMAAVMGSVQQPDLNSVNVSANTYVDGTILAASMSGITSVFSQGLFFDIIVMSIMMATAGYVLFGKR